MDMHEELVLNYYFQVIIENQTVSFAKVSGLNMEVETEMISEGGYNQIGYPVVTAAKNTKTMRLSRGVCRDNNSILCKLFPGIYLPQGIVLTVLKPEKNKESAGKPIVQYVTGSALVTKWEMADLDAKQGQILVNTFEIAYTELKREKLG